MKAVPSPLTQCPEANIADLAESSMTCKWVPTALDGINKSLELIYEKGIKIVINGGGLDPKGLAEEVQQLVQEKKLKIRVAYVDGDNLMPKVHQLLQEAKLPHLDSANSSVLLAKTALTFLEDPQRMPVVAANAYLGYRAIKAGLELGADIIIFGRVADASPVIAAAAWWHGWAETNYNELAGALVAGHLIECSTYATGGNFSGQYQYPVSAFLNLGLPIAEVSAQGECVITKHESLNGFVTPNTIKCQFLYELQGNIYLNSDVKADLKNVSIVSQAKDRVHVSGIRGYPPPPTTKLAVFYHGGYQCEFTIYATGCATAHKWDLQEAQMRSKLKEWGLIDRFDILEFQRIGVPSENPDSQLASTTAMRTFAQSIDLTAVESIARAWTYNFMAHFAGRLPAID